MRDFFGRELTGTYLEDDAFIDIASMGRMIARGRPAQGVMPVKNRDKDHLIQFWLKLPLAEDGRSINMILGFDVFL